ncbi:MAG: ATP-binding protein [Alphaproteobacteria bacterium]|nr:ATP-binding protein [Alphaproteobacteria bacterium]
MVQLQRQMSSILEKTIEERPLVYLNGPRQAGKSWLTNHMNIDPQSINYITFDSPLVLAGVKSDPESFIKSLSDDKLSVIDEVQLAPEIFRYLKIAIDESRTKGRNSRLYLLTGSANLMALPELSESLVGRMAVLTLLPISSSEYKETGINFISRLFNEDLSYKKYEDYDLLDVITHATFPELASTQKKTQKNLFGEIENPSLPTSNKWYDHYLTTILQRDIKNIADIRKPEKLVMLLSFLALRAGSLLNDSTVAGLAGISNQTYKNYRDFLVNTFIIFELQSWSTQRNLTKRFTKAPKVFFNDTNLLVYMLKRDIYDIFKNDRPAAGHVFENFIATEIMKNAASLTDINISHFRTSDNKEVDFVVEKYNGDTVGIEVKLDRTVQKSDFNGLNVLQQAAGGKFKKGIVIYTGNDIVSFGNNLWAVPVCYLWER